MRFSSCFFFTSTFFHLVTSQSTTSLSSTTTITPTVSRATSAVVTTASSSTSRPASASATNTNVAVFFDTVPGALYACASYQFTWTLPADLAPGSRSALIDLFVTNENIDQAIPAQGGGSSSSSSSLVSSGSASSVSAGRSVVSSSSSSASATSRPIVTSSASVRVNTTSLSTPAAATSTVARSTVSQAARGLGSIKGGSAALLPLVQRERHSPTISSRAIPSGSDVINRNITLVTASSNAYTYPQVVLPLGRYIIYATEHGNANKILGSSAPFTVLNGANPACLSSSETRPDPTGVAGGSEASSTSSGVDGGTIAGVVIGAIVGTLIIAFIAFWFWRKRQRKSLWLSQSSRRMFDGGDGGWRGFVPAGLTGRRGGSKRDSQRSIARGFNDQDISGPITTPGSTTSSTWRSPIEEGHQTQPSMGNYPAGFGIERKNSDEEKHDMGVYGSQRDQGRSIELTRLQPLGAPLGHGVGLNIPVLNKDQEGHQGLGRSGMPPVAYDYSRSASGSTSPTATSPAKSWNAHSSPFDPERDDRSYQPDDVTLSTPSSQRHTSATGLQRNASVASTTLGKGAGIGRSMSTKRHSTGMGSNTKRKPVPMMGGGSSPTDGQPPRLGDMDRGESTEEMLTERGKGDSRVGSHDGMSRQSSTGSLAVSSSEGTVRPGLVGENNSRRSSFLLMPDRPLDQQA